MNVKKDLHSTVAEYGRGVTPMHMPGHKRNTLMLGSDLPYEGDITEIDGFDNLHDPEENGLLQKLSRRAAALYGAKRAFPLINGSTGGILAAIHALTLPGEEILVARNCHKSVYHAVSLCGLVHTSLLPETDVQTGICGSIRPEAVTAALQANPQIRTVVVTSPTYEGVVSDIGAIAKAVHAEGARLLVDAAHGAHLGFSRELPAFPVEADIVVTSLHKTLPALTQTALALVYAEDIALADALARSLAIFETSSPSYVLLASIDRCISLLEQDAPRLFEDYTQRLRHFYENCASLTHLSLLTGERAEHPSFFGFDRGKLLIRSDSPHVTGPLLAERLRREFSIEVEMAYTDYILCMTSICDSDESFRRLGSALRTIDASLPDAAPEPHYRFFGECPHRAVTIAEAARLPDAPFTAGEISRVYAWVYPPGVPLIVPGETVTETLLAELRRIEAHGLKVHVVPQGKRR